MRRLTLAFAIALAAALLAPFAARAAIGFEGTDATFTEADGSPATQAGSHPYALTNSFNLTYTEEGGEVLPTARLKDVLVEQVSGFAGDTTAYPRCTTLDFMTVTPENSPNACSADTVVGVTASAVTDPNGWNGSAVFNLVPPPGVVARFGFRVVGVTIIIDIGVEHRPPYTPVAAVRDTPEPIYVFGSKTEIWGNPSDPAHDALRGRCYGQIEELEPGEEFEFESDTGKTCPVTPNPKPFLTLPTRCAGPNVTSYTVDSWTAPGAYLPDGEPDLSDPNWITESVELHDEEGEPLPFTGCGRLGFKPSITAKPTTKAASSPTGLDFALDVNDEGLTSLKGLAQSDIEKTVVTLPEGMSINPSIAEGLEVCTRADIERESLEAEPGEGCPQASKIGSIEVESPLIDDVVKGALYQAQQDDPATAESGAENPFDSLVAFYIVLKNKELGIIVKQPVRVEPDPVTGQLRTVAEELPQLPFSHFRLHFREGVHSPLASPAACGSYDVKALLYPYSGEAPVESLSTFQIVSGPNEGPCPAGGLPPFKPGLIAGTINNRAGSFSPFNLRLFRNDSEQEITHFSIKLPPGITGKLAGIPYCSDAQIALAESREHTGGGKEELNAPACPAASQIGRTLAGSGVGPALAYAPGKVYLAGPYHGSNLSMVAITAGVVGPFDIGTVVVREAFKIDPETAEVFVDATGSDPIPHIVDGIPVHLRDIRAYVDRPEFVLNPTDCRPTSTASTVLGAGLDFVSEADDNPVTVSSRFQAADCAALTFAPRLTFRLIGGTKRGKFPKLVSHLQMNGIGESGIDHASVILPRSEFIENAHFVNICTRVQFKDGAGNGANCPAGSIYGHARAVTPILSEPLEGPVMLRSNPERQLPDVVAALHNAQVDFDLVGNVDSVKGQLRTTFAQAPDAPVTSFDLELEGGSKGLFVNSTNLCLKKHFVAVAFGGQNGKQFTTKPLLQVKCKGKGKKAKHRRKRGRR